MKESIAHIWICAVFIGLTFSCSENQAGEPTVTETDEANPVAEKESVNQVIKQYESALNSRSLEAIMSLLATDAVVLAEDQAPAIGKTGIEETYTTLLRMYTDFKITMDVQQIDLFGSGAVAWSVNSGSGTLAENGEEVAIHSKSLFFLKKNEDGKWSIYQYMFNRSRGELVNW